MADVTPVVPVEKLTDCGNGYGVARVRDAAGNPYQVKVDLNTDDHTSEPQVILEDGSRVVVGDPFMTAYRALTATEPFTPDNRAKVCEEVRDSGRVGLWRVSIPAGAIGGNLLLQSVFFNRLSDIPGFDSDPQRIIIGYVALPALRLTTTAAYTGYVPDMSPTSAVLADSLYGLAGGVAAYRLFDGSGGDPALDVAVGALTDIAAARVYRHAGGWWGDGALLAFGAAEVALGLLACPSDPRVTEMGPADRDIYVDPGETESPYHQGRTRFDNCGLTLTSRGIGNLVLGGYRMIERAMR